MVISPTSCCRRTFSGRGARAAVHSLILRTGPLLLALAAMACGEQRVTPPGSRGQIAVLSGDQQRGAPGQRLARPIVITVRDPSGTPIAGVAGAWLSGD